MSLIRVQEKLMGNLFEFCVINSSIAMGKEQIFLAMKEIKRIEQMLSTYQEDSITNKINRSAGIRPIHVPEEFYNLVYRAQKISILTQGYFDLSYASLVQNFRNINTSLSTLPDLEEAKKSVQLIDYRNIILNPEDHSIFLKNKGMRIGFSGIGKGYAADCAKKMMVEAGVKSGIVNASGDLNTWGTQENGNPWTIGIANPNLKEELFSSFQITDKSVATSGNYEKDRLIGNQKYSHTINPKTGYPIKGLKSAIIITSNAELADAMATPIYIMGVKPGLNLINQIKGIECILVDDTNRIFLSNNIKLPV